MKTTKPSSAREVAEQVIRDWVEHDLDDHYEDGHEFVITMPPTELLERFEAALKERDKRAANIARGEDCGLRDCLCAAIIAAAVTKET